MFFLMTTTRGLKQTFCLFTLPRGRSGRQKQSVSDCISHSRAWEKNYFRYVSLRRTGLIASVSAYWTRFKVLSMMIEGNQTPQN